MTDDELLRTLEVEMVAEQRRAWAVASELDRAFHEHLATRGEEEGVPVWEWEPADVKDALATAAAFEQFPALDVDDGYRGG